VDAGLLQFRCIRPSLLGLEAHLMTMQEVVSDFAPTCRDGPDIGPAARRRR
jgi:hypothetical protein